ncbi:MAG: hypothetical protein ACREMY_30325 [bacterium]
MFEQYYEPQSPRSARVAGYLAIAAGIFGLGFGVWLFVHEALPPISRSSSAWMALIAAMIGAYSLALGRRLLRGSATATGSVVGPWALIVVGLYLAVGAAMVAMVDRDLWYYQIEGGVLGLAAVYLGWQRLRGLRDSAK